MGPKFKSPAPKNYFDMLMHAYYPTAGWGSEKSGACWDDSLVKMASF